MNRKFKVYAACWAILLALFNVICFVTPSEAAGMVKFGGAFWTGYIFITLAFIGQLICAFYALKPDNLQKLFYNIPLITISYTGLIIMLVVGALAMTIPNLPNWIGIIVCLIILAFTAIAVISAKAAGTVVSNIDEKIKTNTAFIKEMTVETQNLMNRANAPKLKEYCKKVYEALRYSDPMLNEQLTDIENRIKEEFDALTDAVISDDLDGTETGAKELCDLINVRNRKCKLLKDR